MPFCRINKLPDWGWSGESGVFVAIAPKKGPCRAEAGQGKCGSAFPNMPVLRCGSPGPGQTGVEGEMVVAAEEVLLFLLITSRRDGERVALPHGSSRPARASLPWRGRETPGAEARWQK